MLFVIFLGTARALLVFVLLPDREKQRFERAEKVVLGLWFRPGLTNASLGFFCKACVSPQASNIFLRRYHKRPSKSSGAVDFYD